MALCAHITRFFLGPVQPPALHRVSPSRTELGSGPANDINFPETLIEL